MAPGARFCPRCGVAIDARGAPATAASSPSGPPGVPTAPGGVLVYGRQPTPYEDRPTGAGILAIVGGLFILLGGVAEAFIGSTISTLTFGQAGGLLVGLGALGVLMGILIVIFGILILVSDEGTGAYGIVVIVFSVISLASAFGGFIIGFILALIGGILALTWEPLSDPGTNEFA